MMMARNDHPTAVLSAPTATVGMIGGGQLGRMTQQAAIALGIDLRVLSDEPQAPAVLAGATLVHGSHHELDAVLELAQTCDVVTLDHEHTPDHVLQAIVAHGHLVRPNPDAARLAQDKLRARRAFSAWGLPVPAFAEVAAGDTAAVERFAAEHGWPVVLKAPTGGYDGRGVEVVGSPAELAICDLAQREPRWLIEEAVPIATELAVLIARRPSGHSRAYPLIETVQDNGICRELVTPARVDAAVAERAVQLAATIADTIDVTGILAVELFLTDAGDLVINEIATRPHNSGHITIEAAVTSQFENHLRAVLDWPLGDTALVTPAAATVNLIGPQWPVDFSRTLPLALEDPAVHVHLYRKTSRPGRKIGHITARAATPEAALHGAHRAVDRLLSR
jgi:5-(carboxyamino)imidazole ribonucleotide synthase